MSSGDTPALRAKSVMRGAACLPAARVALRRSMALGVNATMKPSAIRRRGVSAPKRLTRAMGRAAFHPSQMGRRPVREALMARFVMLLGHAATHFAAAKGAKPLEPAHQTPLSMRPAARY